MDFRSFRYVQTGVTARSVSNVRALLLDVGEEEQSGRVSRLLREVSRGPRESALRRYSRVERRSVAGTRGDGSVRDEVY